MGEPLNVLCAVRLRVWHCNTVVLPTISLIKMRRGYHKTPPYSLSCSRHRTPACSRVQNSPRNIVGRGTLISETRHLGWGCFPTLLCLQCYMSLPNRESLTSPNLWMRTMFSSWYFASVTLRHFIYNWREGSRWGFGHRWRRSGAFRSTLTAKILFWRSAPRWLRKSFFVECEAGTSPF